SRVHPSEFLFAFFLPFISNPSNIPQIQPARSTLHPIPRHPRTRRAKSDHQPCPPSQSFGTFLSRSAHLFTQTTPSSRFATPSRRSSTRTTRRCL
ncbi:hypothetical protein FA13DRAFT_1737800, partial [Coprinellus micaceus]